MRSRVYDKQDDEQILPEVRARVVRMVAENEAERRFRWAAVSSIDGLEGSEQGRISPYATIVQESEVASRKEVFHFLRGGNIKQMCLAKLEPRTIRMHAGHQIGVDEHDVCGSRSITEKSAIEIASIGLDPEVDYSVFKGLNFDKLAG